MNERMHQPGRDTLEAELQDVLGRAPWGGPQEDVNVDAAWQTGRRRRTRKRAGALAAAGLGAAAVVATVWSSGLMGGSRGPDPVVASVIPDGMTTFVFAAPDAPDLDPSTISALTAPQPEELHGTTWELQDALWGEDGSASQALGTDLPTVLNFQPTHWGVLTDRCGAFVFKDLTIAADGRFTPQGLADADQGCNAQAQAAEDLWEAALSAGGYVHELGGGNWLLLSVQLPPSGTVAPTGPEPTDWVAVETEEAEPGQTNSAPPATTTPPPTTPATQTPSDPPPPDEPSTVVPPGPAFLDPSQTWVDEPWPAAGGGLFAPTVRAGTHDGFDRVVVDLTGTPEPPAPGWRAAWTEAPTRDGSGLPMAVAGDSVLEIVLNSMGLPEPGDPVYDGGDAGRDTHTLPVVVEVIRTTPFEGQLQVFVGVDGQPRPYRTFLLQDPMRLVIDIQH